MLGPEHASNAPQEDHPAQKRVETTAEPRPVYAPGTPLYYAIGQTPPYPGIYAMSTAAMPSMDQSGPVPAYAMVVANGYCSPCTTGYGGSFSGGYAGTYNSGFDRGYGAGYPQQQGWMRPSDGAGQASGTPYVTTPQPYVAMPQPSLDLSPASLPSLSPSIPLSTPARSHEPLTPTTPSTVKAGSDSTMLTFKVRPPRSETPLGDGAKHFLQLVEEIFLTRRDELAFPLVDALITREFNTQRRHHEAALETSELEKKDENGYYVCRLCGPEPPRYLHLKSLVRHTSTHFATKPFTCLFCQDRFTRTDVARKHLLSCRSLRASLLRFGHERALHIQKAMSSAQRCMLGGGSSENYV